MRLDKSVEILSKHFSPLKSTTLLHNDGHNGYNHIGVECHGDRYLGVGRWWADDSYGEGGRLDDMHDEVGRGN